ncbi:MAG: hypothetical protein E6Q31_00495 [Aquabacterium sp.]|nr:MAG: hypothetical protein E6Q31_00495 [Aquabacterium sp.]
MAEIKSAEVHADAVNMLNRLPRHMPALPVILADIGSPPLDLVARTFGVTVTTVKRWMKHGAPKPVLFSLWWLTRWGMSELDAEQFNRAQLSHQLAQAYSREMVKLKQQIEHLQRIGTFGAANDPLCGMEPPRLRPARTLKPRQNPQAEPVMSCASVRARHLETAPA